MMGQYELIFTIFLFVIFIYVIIKGIKLLLNKSGKSDKKIIEEAKIRKEEK